MPRQLTKAARIVYALLARGSREVLPSSTRKARQFTSYDQQGAYFYVGPQGGLRTGRNYSHSRSLEHTIAHLLRAYPHPDYKPLSAADQPNPTPGDMPRYDAATGKVTKPQGWQ